MIATIVCALVNLLISGAIELVWRRRREAPHARIWTLAFALTAVGWAIAIWTSLMNLGGGPSGAAASLCWLAAALTFVQGLRRRAGRADRSAVLIAIWGGVAFGMALLLDVGRQQLAMADAAVPLLAAIGLMLAAIAVGPRSQRGVWLDASAMALLALLALAYFGFAWVRIDAPGVAADFLAVAPQLSVPAFVALGLAAMLLLNDDLTAALDRLARTDPLTRVWNRRGFDEGTATLIERLRSSSTRMAAVAIADIDSFKAINDQYGHHAGDQALVRFARLLKTAAQRGDLVARLGGEEFALLALGVDGPALMERIERARALIALPDERGTLPMAMTASFGIAQLSPHTLSLRDALERADRALYRAKKTGKNRSVLADDPSS